MGLRAGRLDRRVAILHRGVQRNSFGEEIQTWGVWATVWASVEIIAGGESIEVSQRTSTQTARFTLRWRAGVTPEMKLRHDGREWDIVDVAEMDRRVTLVVTAVCREVGSGRLTGA